MTRSIALVALTLVAIIPATAGAHATLTYPAPRTLANKAGPCGAENSGRGSDVAVFEPGETITVTWDETVDHPGHYRIAFDDDGDDDFPEPRTPEDDFPTTLVDQIPDREGGGLYSQDITFPDVECESCTLQVIQIMTTRVPYDSFYFQCADIALRGGEGGAVDDEDNGCAVTGGNPGSLAAMAFAALIALARRRR